MDIDWHIGDVIAKLRKRRRMNQTVLAAKVGVNKATIVRAEDGDPKVSRETYLNIARVLGTRLVSLEVEAARLGSRDGADTIRQPGVTKFGGTAQPFTQPTGSARADDGRALAVSPEVPPDAQPDPLSGELRAEARRAARDLDRLARHAERAAGLAQPTRAARTTRQHAAAPRAPKARARAPLRKSHR